ncbi:splicing regulatory glutamine/lysine-rich protein 1 isoform X1 [Alosa alosa]|uniref:splicing regulatory glutamine/lysine-rich protein 1 isoform X1 n=1 Tax=Alosa alosa TaxID=278164 RepID=UPI00201546EF|nr:splicing regulatory glutamine/lysine-rich protein 1 isoform X1 [Alosa alosa]
MSGIPGTAVIQITNLSSAVNSEQMRTLFGFLGDIEELRLYPPDNAPLSFSSKVCYIKYRDPSSVGVAQHLTNTVFIDRALIVVPCAEGKIPEEAKALSLLAPSTPVTNLLPSGGGGLLPSGGGGLLPSGGGGLLPSGTGGLLPSATGGLLPSGGGGLLTSGGGLLPIPTPSPNRSVSLPPVATLAALPAVLDTSLGALGGVSQPPIMGNVDPSKIDEIRRTVYVGNLNSQTTTAEQLLEYFKQVGDVKFVRMAGDETQPTRFAFVEFADQDSVARALTFNGVMFGDRPLKINHSNNAIVKPPELTPQAAAKELEDVMKRVREAQSTIAAAIEPADEKRSSSRSRRSRRSRSRSRSRSRTRSRSRSRRRRSRSRQRSRTSQRSRHGDSQSSRGSHRRRSCSRDRRHSRSRSRDRRKEKDGRGRNKDDDWDRDDWRKEKRLRTPPKSYSGSRRSHSTIRGYRKRSQTRSRSPRRKAKSPTPKRGKKDKKREKTRDSSRERRVRSTSRRMSTRDKDRQDGKAKHTQVECDYDNEEKEYESDASGSGSEDVSPPAQHNGSYRSRNGGDDDDDELPVAEATA